MAAILAVANVFFLALTCPCIPADTLYVAETSFGSFDQATRITIGPHGLIYIIDAKKNAVLIFKSALDQPFVLGGYGWSPVTFDTPTGVATDGLNVYVSDFGNHRIQRFDRYSHLVSSLNTRDTAFSAARFGYPMGVALSNLGDLIILDSENLRVVEFSSESRFERSFGDLSSSGGKLQYPVKVTTDGDKYIYVLERRRILQFDFFGNYVRAFAREMPGEIVGGQATTEGIVAVSADTLYWFTLDGSLNSKIPFSLLISEVPVRPVQDVGILGNQIFLLSPTRCHIFRMESLNR